MEKIIDRILKHILQYNGSRFRVNIYLKDFAIVLFAIARRLARRWEYT